MKPTTKRTVMKMRDAYERTIRRASTENLRRRFPDRPWMEDVSSVWISKKDIETLLNVNNANGLRIYIGCHDASTDADPKRDCNGMQNLIFVATKDSVNQQEPSSQTSIDQLRETEENVTSFEGVAATGTTCPPYCPTPPPPPPPPPSTE